MKKRQGFTLVEIMVVVGVLGLLAGLASLGVLRAHEKALVKQAEGELEMLAAATLQLAWDTGKWPNQAVRTQPGSKEIWDLSEASAGLLGTDGAYADWKGPYFEDAMMDPWGKPYFFDPDYRIDGVNHVVVGSFGPNRRGRNEYDDDDIRVLLDD